MAERLPEHDVVRALGATGGALAAPAAGRRAEALLQRARLDDVQAWYQQGSVFRLRGASAVCVLCLYETDEGRRIVPTLPLMGVKACKAHPACDGRLCWRFRGNVVKLWQADAFHALEKMPMHIAPRFVTDWDTKVAAGNACYAAVEMPAPAGPCDDQALMPTLPAASLRGLVLDGAVLGAEEARALHAVFPLQVLWFVHQDGRNLQPAELACPKCGDPCELKSVNEWSKYGVGLGCIFRACVVTVRCSSRGDCPFTSCSTVDQRFAGLLPAGVEPMFAWDRVGDRVYSSECVDYLCDEFRARFNQNALRTSLARRLLSKLMRELPAADVVRLASVHAVVYAHVFTCLPRPKELANIVLLVFQRFERPFIEAQVKMVCARYGWILIFDGSSAPLQETRTYPLPAFKKNGRKRRKRQPQPIGAGIACHGTFDVPLMPWVAAARENQVTLAVVGAYVVFLMQQICSDAAPLGWVDDCTERSFHQSTRAVEHMLFGLAQNKTIIVDRVNFIVAGFFRGIDPKHVQWRLEDTLLRTSFDFECAVDALSWLFRMFNPGAFDPDSADSDPEDDTAQAGQAGAVAPVSVLDALEKFMANVRVICAAGFATSIVDAFLAGSLRRACDGQSPPRCVVSLLLWRLGHRDMVVRLWWLPPTVALYYDELEGFEAWFRVPMATRAWAGSVRTKRGSRQRVTLRRDDTALRGRASCAAVNSEWVAAKANQQRPIVANALIASYSAKRLLVQCLGPGATSLGSTGVERGWWTHHVHNTNKTGVWATNAYRQFRAVVVWKRQVRASLRRRLEHVVGTRGSGSGKQAQALAEECDGLAEQLAGQSRSQLLLPPGEALPVEPSATELNFGLDAFRRQLQHDGFDWKNEE